MKLIQPVEQPRGGPRGASINNAVAQAAIWSYYRLNLDRVVLKVAFIKIRVRDLKPLFELLAGPEPV
jgi:hypothetical protein